MMDKAKLDQYGFIDREWATAHVPGFVEMDPCCQQLELLFPNVPHRCADLVGMVANIHSLPNTPVEWGNPPAAALVPIVALPFLHGGNSKPNVPVDEPTILPMLLAGLMLLAAVRRLL
jgi:hypothetical protein